MTWLLFSALPDILRLADNIVPLRRLNASDRRQIHSVDSFPNLKNLNLLSVFSQVKKIL